jgi:hypothetical protein
MGLVAQETYDMRNVSLVDRPSLRFLAALPLLVAVAGCSSELDIPEFFEVTYSVSNQSLGTVTQITFINDLDDRQALTPDQDEFSSLYLKPKGQTIGMTAEGTVWDGTVTLTIEVVGNSKSFTRTDSCEDFSGQEVACSLEIPDEIL